MANDYYDSVPVAIPEGTRARASQVNAVSQAVEAGFDKLPTEEQLKEGTTRYAVDTGVADAYIVTLPYTITLQDGLNLYFKAVNANTGASTINVNGTGVKAIRNVDGSELIANTFGANTLAQIIYNATTDTWQLLTQSPEAEQAKIAAEAAAAAAAVSEANAAASEANAATSETNAATSETNAATSETNAATSETNAGISETNAEAAFDSFDARYLGSKVSDPTLDNQGGALIDGALYWNTTVNEIRVYDLGGTSWGALTNSGNATSLDGLDSTQFLRSDAINTNFNSGATAAYGLVIQEDALTAGSGLRVESNSAGMTAQMVDFEVINAAATGSAMRIQHADGRALEIVHPATSSVSGAIDVRITNTGRGIFVADEGSLVAGGNLLSLNNSTNSGRNTPLATINNAQDTPAKLIDMNQDGNDIALQIVTNNDGVAANGIYVYNNSGAAAADLVQIIHDSATATGRGLAIQQDGTGDGLYVTANNAGGVAGSFYSNAASRTQPVVEVVNDNATGTGVAMSIQQDSSGVALAITTNGGDGITIDGTPVTAGSPVGGADTQFQYNNGGSPGGIADWVWNDANDTLTITTNNTGGISNTPIKIVANAITASPVIDIDLGDDGNLTSGVGVQIIGKAGGGASDFVGMINTQSRNTTAAARFEAATVTNNLALYARSATANRTRPVALIENDATIGASVNLELFSRLGPHLDLTGTSGEGIKFSTVAASTDVNTLDDYEEGTWTPSLGGTEVLSIADGTYTKIGRMVHFKCRMVVTTIGTGSTSLISGLPFNSSVGSEQTPAAIGGFAGLAPANIYGVYAAVLGNNSDTISLLVQETAGGDPSTVAAYQNGASITIAGTYETDE